MGQITTGVGLISGINTADLIDKLIAIDAKPKDLLTARNAVLTSQTIAFQDINAKLLGLKLSSGSFTSNKVFQSTTTNTSDPTAITASSGNTATPGSYSFTVARLVSTQQLITQGFSDTTATAVAPSGGTLTFEQGSARLDAETPLSQLNGGAGISRGKIRITDKSGASAVIDLTRVVSVNDVLDAVNSASGINVTAAVDGDHIVLTDNTGQTTTSLNVTNLGTTATATSLGIAGAAVGTTLTGSQINRVGSATLLDTLNDGNGVRLNTASADIRIQRRDGTTFDVALGGATKFSDIISKINTASGGDVTAAVGDDGVSLKLTDTSTDNGSTFGVTALNSPKAASDLGILTADDNADGIIGGARLLAGLNSRLVKNLNGGTGASLGVIAITNRAGVAFTADLTNAKSISDVVAKINEAGATHNVSAALNDAGNGIKLSDATGSTASNFIVSNVTGTGATDLGIAQSVASDAIKSGNLQFRYISEATRLSSLNGGTGITRGKFTITDSAGASATVDLTQGNEVTLADVIAEINSRGLAVNARINDTGDGLLIEDTGPGTLALKIGEAGSTTAKDLGILGSAANPGEAINGSFEKTVTIGATDTLQDAADAINAAGLSVRATIISDGSGVNPYRLSLLSTKSGQGGSFTFDDGGLGLGATSLVKGRDAVVFFGSPDAGQSVAITSTTNTLTAVIPGATINLLNTSSSPVQVNISRDDSQITAAVQKFVTDFNTVVDAFGKYDSYNADTQQKGLLLGDPTIANIRSSFYSLINGRNSDLTTQFATLSSIGITVGDGAKLSLNQEKFAAALQTDRNAVQQLFTYKETTTNSAGNQVLTKGGIGARLDALLKKLTDTDGPLLSTVNTLNDTIKLNTDRMATMDITLANKRSLLQAQFNAMEQALAQMQSQSSSLTALSSAASASKSG
ncbi:MAG: flagellar filament capping protein FliD [Planctomycetes bacterium]|nr:flagellar filament capping protein FliD [Planctomycetota bacterium]